MDQCELFHLPGLILLSVLSRPASPPSSGDSRFVLCPDPCRPGGRGLVGGGGGHCLAIQSLLWMLCGFVGSSCPHQRSYQLDLGNLFLFYGQFLSSAHSLASFRLVNHCRKPVFLTLHWHLILKWPWNIKDPYSVTFHVLSGCPQ